MRKASKPKHKFPRSLTGSDRWVWDLTCRWANEYSLYLIKEWLALKQAEDWQNTDDFKDQLETLNRLAYKGFKGIKTYSKIQVAETLCEWLNSAAVDANPDDEDTQKHLTWAEEQMQIWAAAEAWGTYRPKRAR